MKNENLTDIDKIGNNINKINKYKIIKLFKELTNINNYIILKKKYNQIFVFPNYNK